MLDLQSLLPPQFFFPHSFSSPLFFQLLPLLFANDVSVRFPSASNSASLYPFPFPYLQEPLKPNPPRHHHHQSRTLGFSFCSMPQNFVYFLHFLIYLVKKARKLVSRQRLLRCVYGGFRVQAPTPPTSPPRSPRVRWSLGTAAPEVGRAVVLVWLSSLPFLTVGARPGTWEWTRT